MKSATTLLNDLSFQKTHTVDGRASIADLFRAPERCGIYVLHFANREYYVGQAVDVTRRYVQHAKNHDDIVRISFKQVARYDLNEVEREAISTFETNRFLLRNISLTSIPKGESDFDLIMPLSHKNNGYPIAIMLTLRDVGFRTKICGENTIGAFRYLNRGLTHRK